MANLSQPLSIRSSTIPLTYNTASRRRHSQRRRAMHTHAKRKLSSLSSAEASTLLRALDDCYQRFENLDLEALEGLHDTIASLQLRLRHISLSKATENSLELCGIQAAWPPVLRSTLGQYEATSPLVRDSRMAGGDKPVSSDGLDNLLARIDRTFFTKVCPPVSCSVPAVIAKWTTDRKWSEAPH